MIRKKNIMLILFSVSLLIFACSDGVKDIDRNRYGAVIIGDQEWMTANLSVSRFRNGDPIPEAKTPEEWILHGREGKPAWCIQKNTGENGPLYGKLYNWYAVSDPRGLAPEGWHIPSDDEWKKFTDFLGGEITAAFKIRTTGLDESDEAGFGGLAGGCCNASGNLNSLGSHGFWWTSTEVTQTSAWMRQLNYIQSSLNSIVLDKNSGLSVRCVKGK
jgi:uncharacterized protein (TIGR02145 family)